MDLYLIILSILLIFGISLAVFGVFVYFGTNIVLRCLKNFIDENYKNR